MPTTRKRPQPPDEVIKKADKWVPTVLSEMVENALFVQRQWTLAVKASDTNLDLAMDLLIAAEIRLDTHVRVERRDALRAIRLAIDSIDSAV